MTSVCFFLRTSSGAFWCILNQCCAIAARNPSESKTYNFLKAPMFLSPQVGCEQIKETRRGVERGNLFN